MSVVSELQSQFHLEEPRVRSIIALIDDGNTIPFIARYRKEMTGNLDDQVLRQFHEKLVSLRAVEERREDIRRLIAAAGQMTEPLGHQLDQAVSLAELEDLYRPYRPKRRTRAMIARERGLLPLAERLMARNSREAELLAEADRLIDPEKSLPDREAVFAGVSDIVAEIIADDPGLRKTLRELIWRNGQIVCRGKTDETTVYQDYYDFREPVSRIPGHRVLAINRGENEKILSVRVDTPYELAEPSLRRFIAPGSPSPCDSRLLAAAADAWKRLILPSLDTEVRNDLTERAETGALSVFGANLRSVLLQPPIRGQVVMGLDPGYRTGCKLCVIGQQGQVLATGVIYPAPPHERLIEAADTVDRLVRQHQVTLIAIGNGTASRETERFAAGLIHERCLPVRYLMVNESGASVYSASALAAAEFPEYDVSLRSAISIARRIQDPLAELVKVDPKSIGVGQYQHDLPEKKLDETLTGVVESCVNEVGVDLNTSSARLLSYVAGINETTARSIEAYRRTHGKFRNRHELLSVPRLGARTFEQCAGFMRIPDSPNYLDTTSVHPENYEAVIKIGRELGLEPSPELARRMRQADPDQLSKRTGIGPLTLVDILNELEKPGRDPRDDLPQPTLRADVIEMKDLKPGMVLQGVVRNVADFGAFVDIGVHQDGLVHLSELSDRYVRHPLEVVKAGMPVTVRVLSVDVARKRIALSMKSQDGKRS